MKRKTLQDFDIRTTTNRTENMSQIMSDILDHLFKRIEELEKKPKKDNK